ncbi:zinc finger protein 600-like isoform X2 [Belonocnema kinseyi]|uniref:zinc finger protein 600-like isoform X2 n=1 Tax=Belonocnema kinseyi TaxID=2817044 RepID=UPI00143D5FA8|nr:zinc finger protein 600-like isoform X2 [Belonocnema kinseyi]
MFIVTKKIDSENISKLCRTCLREDNDKMVWQGDGLPENMCDRCVTRAESALLYREQCQVADSALRQAALKVPCMKSYAAVSGCKQYQQNPSFLSTQNAQNTLKCVECRAVFMNYQELCLHSRLHVPFLPESNIPSQHMHIVESPNTCHNLNHLRNNSINIHINSMAEDDVCSRRTACALHCSHCNHTFSDRTQLINHSLAHDVSNTSLLCDEENIQIRNISNPVSRNWLLGRPIQHPLEKTIPNLQYPSQSFVNETKKIRNVAFSGNSLHNIEQFNNTNGHQNISFHPEATLPVSLNFDPRKIIQQNNDEKVSQECFVASNCLTPIEKFYSKKSEDIKNKTYECEKCGRFFLQESKFQSHWLSHSDNRPFKCFRCHKAYACKSKLNAHMRLHTKSNVHPCKICNKIFTYPSYLLEHMNAHKSNNHKLKDQKQIFHFECNICKKKFQIAKLLNAHLRLHSGIGLSQCNVCDKKFNHKYSLKVHLQSHEAKKVYKCEYCDKSFTQKSNLVEHIRIHTKVKPFECNLCSKKFCQSSHLKSHVASHDSARQHRCQLCGKRFKLVNHLKRHLNSHTRSKTYRCEKCNHVFSQAFSLRRHLKRHDES